MSSNEQKLKRRCSALRGRQLEPAVLSELRVLLGDEDVDPSLRHRDRLIEHLHALQDTYGYLSMPRLRALATFMNLPMAAIITLTARADQAMPEGMVFVPFAFVEAAANLLTNPALDPDGKIPEFKYAACRLSPA